MKLTLKKFVSVLLTFMICFGTFAAAFAAEEIPEGYTPIYTAEDLNNIRNNLSGKYILMNDIDLSVYEDWEPIGKMDAFFTGAFSGNNLTIRNLTLKSDITTEETNNLGLFGFIKNATISDVNLENISINVNYPYNSTYYIGGAIAYCCDSKLEDCNANGTISVISGGNIYAGGIAGYVRDENKSTQIVNCISNTDIQVVGENNSIWQPAVAEYTYVGGIAGNVISANSISKCTNEGDISVSSINIGIIGSIVGNSKDTEIEKCKNSGNISAMGTCKINETPINITLWSRIKMFFISIFEYIKNIFK